MSTRARNSRGMGSSAFVLQVVGKALDEDDHARPRLLVIDGGGGHELANGFVSGPGELGEEFSAEGEVAAEHFGNGEVFVHSTQILCCNL